MQITYKDKVTLQSNPSIPDENKVTAKDMNEIKSVVNSNEEKQQALNMSVQEIAQNVVNNSQEISNIKEEQTTQNDNIQTNSNNISDLQSNKADKSEIPTDLSQLSNENTKFVNETGLENAISQEKTQRQNADNNLQNQVDTNKTNIQTNATNIATNTQEINTIKAEQTTQNNRLSNLETDNTTNKDNISANTQEINNIKQEQTEQNTNITNNATNIESLQEENDNLKKIVSQLPQVTGQGTSITLENTIEAQFTIFDVEGNSVQDGTPSPDNEVPIKSAGDNENLFDIETSTAYQLCTKSDDVFTTSAMTRFAVPKIKLGVPLTVINGTDYYISYDVKTNSGDAKKLNYYGRLSEDAGLNITTNFGELIGTFTMSNSYQRVLWKTTATSDFTANYLFLQATSEITNAQTISIKNIKISEVNTKTYSPYGMGSINEKITNADGTEEQDYSIFVQQPFRSIGDVRDCFVEKSDGWYERHYISRVIFDGTEEWGQNGSTASTGQYVIATTNKKYGILNLLSNSFVTKQTSTENSIAGRAINRNIYITIDLSIVEFSVAKFKAYLAEKYASGNPVYVDYELETPLDLPCTPEQIQQLENKPSTYKDFTIIQSQDETEAYLEVSGIRDINTMFDKVTNAIVSLGGNV